MGNRCWSTGRLLPQASVWCSVTMFSPSLFSSPHSSSTVDCGTLTGGRGRRWLRGPKCQVLLVALRVLPPTIDRVAADLGLEICPLRPLPDAARGHHGLRRMRVDRPGLGCHPIDALTVPPVHPAPLKKAESAAAHPEVHERSFIFPRPVPRLPRRWGSTPQWAYLWALTCLTLRKVRQPQQPLCLELCAMILTRRVCPRVCVQATQLVSALLYLAAQLSALGAAATR